MSTKKPRSLATTRQESRDWQRFRPGPDKNASSNSYAWREVLTLGGLIEYDTANPGRFMWIVLALFLCWPLTLAMCMLAALVALIEYLVKALIKFIETRKRLPYERRLRVARLEAELGILPATEGTCRKCDKPLQVGAEFCGYCGASVITKPLICPVCATTALPDAHFCPKCRSPLQASS